MLISWILLYRELPSFDYLYTFTCQLPRGNSSKKKLWRDISGKPVLNRITKLRKNWKHFQDSMMLDSGRFVCLVLGHTSCTPLPPGKKQTCWIHHCLLIHFNCDSAFYTSYSLFLLFQLTWKCEFRISEKCDIALSNLSSHRQRVSSPTNGCCNCDNFRI